MCWTENPVNVVRVREVPLNNIYKMSKTYQILQGCYGETHPDTIVLPDDVSLITGGPNDIGSVLHEGHQHYLLCTNKEFFELHKQEFDVPYGQIYENFPDIVFYSICDVKFIDNPPLIEVEEFNKMFSFNDYYITQYLKNGLLLSMCKINKISSESQVEIQYIYNRYLDGSNIFNMGIKNTDLSTLCYSWRDPIYICKNDPIALLYWKQLLCYGSPLCDRITEVQPAKT